MSELEQFAAQLGVVVVRNKARLMTQEVAVAERYLKQEIPARTGTGRRSVHGQVEDGGNRATIGMINYLRFVQEGTGLYGPRKTRIVPKNGRALAFKMGGATIVRRSVAGIHPNPFLDRAVVGSRADVERVFEEWGGSLLREMGF